MRIAVVGLGKIGLPLAASFAGKGASVIGCDLDPAVVEAVNSGVSSVGGEPGLAELVRETHISGFLTATGDTSAAVSQSEVVVVIVPVGINDANQTDFRQLDDAANRIGRGLRPNTLVILESTVPVGVTRGRFRDNLAHASGLEPAALRLAFSPERVSSGTLFRDLATYPKLVGGVDPASGEAAAAFYQEMLGAETMLLPNAETAELAKLAESVYRDLNIALANELAKTAEAVGVDFKAMAAAANSQPYSHLHTPGVGVGGHCIPVYPYLLLESADQPLVRLGRQINDSMAKFAVDKLEKALSDSGHNLLNSRILILGLAFRGDVKESTLSSTLLIAEQLKQRGAQVQVHDPLFSDAEVAAHGLEATALPPSSQTEAIILQANHTEYQNLDLSQFRGTKVFLDGRGGFERERVEAAGMRYLAIGAP